MGCKPMKAHTLRTRAQRRSLRSSIIFGALASAMVSGCVGRIGGPLGGTGGDQDNRPTGAGTTGGWSTGGTEGGTPATCVSAASRRVRRLSQREYFNVVGDLLGMPLAALGKAMFPLEPSIAGFDNQDMGLVVSSAYQEALAQAAEKISGQVVAAQVAPCASASGSTSCLESFAKSLARKAYGRDPPSAELARLMSAAATGDTYEAAVRLIVEVVLQSPALVYATELGPIDAGPSSAQIALTQQEIASQLSLIFTGARPDDELLQAADDARLSRPEDLVAETERLLRTPRGANQLHLLIRGWLDLGSIASAPKDPAAFPAFTPQVTNALQSEVDSFIDAKLAGGEGTFDSL